MLILNKDRHNFTEKSVVFLFGLTFNEHCIVKRFNYQPSHWLHDAFFSISGETIR